MTTPIDAVSRTRRYNFVARCVGFLYGSATFAATAAGMGWVQPESRLLIENYIGGAIGAATTIALAYITGSVVDYNGGLKNVVMGRKEEPKG